jgi:cytochrome oxidase Cu insertion factor (SCO1/SenC/PrrC family)
MSVRRSIVAMTLSVTLGACAGRTPAVPATAWVQQRVWRDERGADVALSDYQGAPFVLSAIYTSCTVRCPLTIQKLQVLDRAFASRGRVAPIVLVTLDPRLDTPARLARFKEAHRLPDHWHLLSGSAADTRALGRYLRLRVIDDDTHVDHDVRIAVFASDGRIAGSYSDWSFDADRAALVR